MYIILFFSLCLQIHTLFTETLVKTKWKNLRDTFRRELRKIPAPRSGDAADAIHEVTWPYYKYLLFLKDQFISRNRGSNIECSHDREQNFIQEDDDKLSQDVLSNQNTSTFSDSLDNDETFTQTPTPTPEIVSTDINNPESSTPELSMNQSLLHPATQIQNITTLTSTNTQPANTVASKSLNRKRHNKAEDAIGEALIELEKEKIKIMRKENTGNTNKSDDEHFFLSLIPYVNNLPLNQKMQLRIKIQNLIYNFLYGAGNEEVEG